MLKILLCVFCTGLLSCKKYLEKPADSSQAPPMTLIEYQQLLDNKLLSSSVTPCVEVLCTDDFTLDRFALDRNQLQYWGMYTWNPSLYQASGFFDESWGDPYKAISYANNTLARLPKLGPDELDKAKAYNSVYGMALFMRAFHYFFLEETYGHCYDPGTAATTSGVVLRLGVDPEERRGRSSVAEVYDQILKDLRAATPLLPQTVQRDYINHPSLPAAYALFARVNLVRRDFTAAQAYADSCLSLTDSLLHYDTVKGILPSHPFDPYNNSEVLLQCTGVDIAPLHSAAVTVDSALYNSYDTNDLRRSLFFRPLGTSGKVVFQGHYSPGYLVFSGLALDEVLLIRAECKARNKDAQGAMDDLNKLLSTRWRPGTYHDYQAATPEVALGIVLRERRKELVGREMRWADVRRTKDEASAVTLRRATGESLAPGGNGYALPIPDSEIQRGGVVQN